MMENTEKLRKLGRTNKWSVSIMVKLALLSALAYVLMLLESPPFLGFLRIELSDLPAVIATLQFGPVAGVVVELIKNIMKIFVTKSAGIGEVANFIIGSAFVIPLGIMYQKKRDKKGIIFGCIAGVISMALVGCLMNYFLVVPIYAEMFGGMSKIIAMASATAPFIKNLETLVILGILPFNIVKGVMISVAGYYLYQAVKKIL